ncbi:MAG: type II secretion system F family protein [Nitrososphaerales archaeon]|jgi:flagellar protein FlaJ
MIVTRYRRTAYFFFRWIDNKPRPGILETLYKADIQMLPGMYIGTIVFTAIIASLAAFAGSYIAFTYVIATGLTPYLILGVTASAGLAAVVAFPLITTGKISSKKVKIEASLPFLLAYMATLSSAGMNPVETIRAVALKDFGPLSTEFRKIVYRFDVLGEDIVSALNYIATNSPSASLHDMLIGISNIIVSGGSLKSYCEQESKSLFDDRKVKLRSFIDSLAAYSEGYVGGVIVTIVLGVIGIIIIGALGVKVLPFLDTQDVMDIFVFFIVPFVNVIFLAMLELKFSGEG